MGSVIFQGCAVNQDVVEEDDDSLAQQGSKNVIHCGLECRRRIAQSKWHDPVFIMSVVSAEGCLWHILWSNPDLMEAGGEVEFRENPSLSQFIEQFVDGWKRKTITDRDGIERSVIHAHAPGSIFLFE